MSLMNPLNASILQAPTAQRIQDTDKSRQMRHAQEVRKNAAATDEQEVEESVASADELPETGDQANNRKQRKKTYTRRPPKPEPENEGGSLDLTA
jgi:hypothetical protein